MQTAYNKRLPRELEQIEKNKPGYLFIENYLDEIEKLNYLCFVTPNGNQLSFKIPNDYPFKPPTGILCNGWNYQLMLKNMPRRIDYLYYNPNEMYIGENAKFDLFSPIRDNIVVIRTKPKCLCCSTLLCPDNWSPVAMIHHILKEIDDHNKLKRQIMYKLVLFDIFEKKRIPHEMIRNVFYFL
jgi:ubiquitin-protein ligase